ncbi:hypothetical protein AGMMS49938_09730 [Fibrobacterales bacterium]|nr:hypothetical protein AGMMS49938_09730 [Fibrobacterales bacterium]
MKKEKFHEIWKGVVIPLIEDKDLIAKIDKLEEEVYAKYEEKNKYFHSIMINKEDCKTDRHKISAAFYVAFVDVTKNIFKENDTLLLVTHEIAFNVAISVIESFIIADENTNEFIRKEINKCGIDLDEEYKKYTIKEFFHAHKANELSPVLLANIFYSIENNFKKRLIVVCQ